MSREEIWNRLLRGIGHWHAYGFGIFALIDNADGRLVGEAGLAYFKRGLGEVFETAPECTWTLAGRAHGKGLATEAVEAAHDWIEGQHGIRRTVCLIHPDNSRSLKFARRFGYKLLRQCTYKEAPAAMLQRVI